MAGRGASRFIARRAANLKTIDPVSASEPGFLRYAVRNAGGGRGIALPLGVVRPYPYAVRTYAQVQPILEANEPPMPGASTLAETLFTLPTHRFVESRWIWRDCPARMYPHGRANSGALIASRNRRKVGSAWPR